MRALIIGASHIAALKLAAPAFLAARPDWRIDFFGADWRRFQRLRLGEDGILGCDPALAKADPVAARDLHRHLTAVNERTEVALGDYDVVLLADRRIGDQIIRRLLLGHDVDGADDRSRPQIMSTACYGAICESLAAARIPDEAWRAHPDRRLFVMPKPFPSAGLMDADGPPYVVHRRLAETTADLRPLYDVYLDAYADALARIGADLLRQPGETYDDRLLTHERYSVGSKRLWALDKAHGNDDYAHMNIDYGALCLDRFASLCPTPA
ncbi:MAG: hypothetical protein AAF360_16395, partial [Pseudomonadota bacterium]